MNDTPATTDLKAIVDALLRYHRKNPLRVAFATLPLIHEHGCEQVERAYEHLQNKELVEPIHYRVQREGASRQCYRITKKGLATEED